MTWIYSHSRETLHHIYCSTVRRRTSCSETICHNQFTYKQNTYCLLSYSADYCNPVCTCTAVWVQMLGESFCVSTCGCKRTVVAQLSALHWRKKTKALHTSPPTHQAAASDLNTPAVFLSPDQAALWGSAPAANQGVRNKRCQSAAY